MPTAHTTDIRTATRDDALALSLLLAEAFLLGDLGPWLIPDLDARARIYRPYFTLLTEQALDHGQVEITTEPAVGLTAAAIWYPIAGEPPPAPVDYDSRLAKVTAAFRHRFTALDDAMHRHHPYDSWHHYLALLAVHPSRQRCGLGSALLAHHHAELDAHGTPVYLEATGTRNRGLYARHGYRPRSPYRITGDGPALFPMWRPAATEGGPA